VRAAPGVLIVPLEQEFDWSRATISFAVGVNLLLYGLVGPFAAALMDRFGVRRTMTIALAVTSAAVALSPALHQAWQLILLWGVVVGAGTGVIGAFLSASIAARWFRARQGLVVGLLTARPRRYGGRLCPARRNLDARPATGPGLDALWC
jgi:MFS family permease